MDISNPYSFDNHNLLLKNFKYVGIDALNLMKYKKCLGRIYRNWTETLTGNHLTLQILAPKLTVSSYLFHE